MPGKTMTLNSSRRSTARRKGLMRVCLAVTTAFLVTVELASAGTRLYVTNRSSDSVSAIDLDTGAVTEIRLYEGTVIPGYQPTGIALSADGSRVYVANTRRNAVSVISTATNSVVSVVPVGLAPIGIVATPTGVYVANSGEGTVSVIDPATLAESKLTGFAFQGLFENPPAGLAYDAVFDRVYIPNTAGASGRLVTVVDNATRSVLTNLVMADGNDGYVAISSNGAHLYASNYRGTVTVTNVSNIASPSSVTRYVLGTPVAGPALWQLALSPDESAAYIASGGHNRIYVLDTGTGAVTSIDGVGIGPRGLAVDAATSRMFVTSDDSRVLVVDTATNVPTQSFMVGLNPFGIVVFRTPDDVPPTASAGADFGVNEGQAGVTLDATGSFDADGDPLMYFWEQVPDGSPIVHLSGATTRQPTFTAPGVAVGGETLTFRLTVTANGESAVDTVSVTVANVNHPPVAEAGFDQTVAEGALVTLSGDASFDIDSDQFSHFWTQVGEPVVLLEGATTSRPTFTAPRGGTGGASGVVATLVFKLTVEDGLPDDMPTPGYSFENAEDTVIVTITNVNNPPIADGGDDITANEDSLITLNGTASVDPDGDSLSFSWVQLSGPAVSLLSASTVAPSFTAPFVSSGGADITFQVTTSDAFGGSSSDTVTVHLQNVNDPPLASAARPTLASLWPPNHGMVAVGITGVTDPQNNATIVITSVTQDEPTNGLGDGDTGIDAVITGDGSVLLRAERSGNGDGRVYHIHFTATDLEGSASGTVSVTVPRTAKSAAVDSGESFVSTN